MKTPNNKTPAIEELEILLGSPDLSSDAMPSEALETLDEIADLFQTIKAQHAALVEAIDNILSPLGDDDIEHCWQYKEARAALAQEAAK